MIKLSSADEALEIWILILRVADTLRKGRQRELSHFGITPEQAGVLQTLHDLKGSARSPEISTYVFRERQSTHQLLERMERMGFLTKVNDSDRKNGVKFTLTEQGRNAQDHSAERQFPRKVLASLTKQERAQFKELLQRVLTEALGGIGVEDNIPLRPPVSRER